MSALTHDEKVLALLWDRKPHSHHEVYGLHVVGHSRISSLRSKGYGIEQYRDGDIYWYVLVSTPEEGTSASVLASGAGKVTEATGCLPAEPPAPDIGQLNLWDSAAAPRARQAA